MSKGLKKTLALVVIIWSVVYVFVLIADLRLDFLPWWDISLYHFLADKLFQGQIPYIDFQFEYPPASILIFGIPRLFTKDLVIYRQLFQALNYLAACGIFILTAKFLQETERKYRSVLVLQLLLASMLIPILLTRFDMIVAFFAFWGFYEYFTGDMSNSKMKYVGYFLIILAGFAKLYPFLIIPILLLYEFKTRGKRNALKSIFICFLLSLPMLIFLAFGNRGLIELLAYHGERGLEIESIYASALFILNRIGITEGISVVYSHASYGLDGSLSSVLARSSTFVFLFAYVFSLWRMSKLKWQKNGHDRIVGSITLVLLLFIITNKVFSTQYFVWLFPWISLALSKEERMDKLAAAGVILAAFLTTLIFPFYWWDLISGNVGAELILAARNIILVIFLSYLYRRFFVSKKVERKKIEFDSIDKVKD